MNVKKQNREDDYDEEKDIWYKGEEAEWELWAFLYIYIYIICLRTLSVAQTLCQMLVSRSFINEQCIERMWKEAAMV
jgi:hypothetical protein